MVNYLVPVDGSRNAMAAFYTALSMMKKDQDELFVVTVVSHFETGQIIKISTPHQLHELQESVVKDGKELLHIYARLCKAQNIKHHLTVLVSNQVGEAICQEIKRQNIEVVVIGRRGMNTLKRLVVGSTSRYVFEHASSALVIAVKGEWGPAEIHTSNRNEINKLEEEERERRSHEKQQHIGFQLSASITALAEETEKLALIESQKHKEAEQHKVEVHTPQILE